MLRLFVTCFYNFNFFMFFLRRVSRRRGRRRSSEVCCFFVLSFFFCSLCFSTFFLCQLWLRCIWYGDTHTYSQMEVNVFVLIYFYPEIICLFVLLREKAAHFACPFFLFLAPFCSFWQMTFFAYVAARHPKW